MFSCRLGGTRSNYQVASSNRLDVKSKDREEAGSQHNLMQSSNHTVDTNCGEDLVLFASPVSNLSTPLFFASAQHNTTRSNLTTETKQNNTIKVQGTS